MAMGAAAAQPRVNHKSAARRQHRLDIHLRCRELGGAAGPLDENASRVAVSARRLTVRGNRARQQDKEGQNMFHVWLDDRKAFAPPASWHGPRRAAIRVGTTSPTRGSNEWPSSTFRSQWATMTAPAP